MAARCTCDDNCDEPCVVHRRENMLQDQLIELRNTAADVIDALSFPGHPLKEPWEKLCLLTGRFSVPIPIVRKSDETK